MRKLYFISPEFNAVDNAASLRTKFNVTAMHEAGMDIEVITPGKILAETPCSVQKIAFPLAGTGKPLFLRIFSEAIVGISVAIFLLTRRHRFDVVITTPPFVVCSIAYLAAAARGACIVLDIRDRYPKVLFSTEVLSSRSGLGRVLSRYEKFMYQNASSVISVTERLCSEIRREVGIEVSLVRNGFDPSVCYPNQSSSSCTNVQEQQPVKVIMHGLFGELFDLDGFLRLVDSTSGNTVSCLFMLVGYGEKLNRIQQMSLPRVVVRGLVSQVEIGELIRDSDIGLSIHTSQGSSQSGFAVKVYEYIGCGVPVFITPDNESASLAGQECLGFGFDSALTQDAVDAFRLMVENASVRARFRKNILSVRSEYSRAEQARIFSQLVFSACKKNRKNCQG